MLLLAASTGVGSADSGSAPGQQAPSLVSAPVVTGTAQQGQTLSASSGSWKGVSVSYAYQWKRCDLTGNACLPVAGATTSVYKPVAGDVGSTLRVAVTAQNKNGALTASSLPTPVVAPAPAAPPAAPVSSSPPLISGTAQSGQTLSASTGSWSGSPSSYGYQWKRCDSSGGACVSLSGATTASYLLLSGDVGSTLRVTVSATNAGGTGTATAAASALVAAAPTLAPPASTGLPLLSGTPRAGQTLSSSTGSWTGSPSGYAYQWKRCDSSGAACTAIAGANANSYLVAATDVGSTLRATVTATNGAGTGTATSAATALVAAALSPPASTTPPAITGTAQAGQTLSASTGSWSGSPSSYAYQWKRCDTAGATCANIGAGGSSYLLASGDVGSTIRVTVTASNAAGTGTATSAATAAVAAAPVSSGDVYSKPVPRSGVSPGYTILNRSSAMQDFELAQIAGLGGDAVRLDYWEEAKADVTVAKALARGLEPELVIGATMHYASRTTVTDFQARCSRAATKYRGKVRYYETLNEPNINGWIPSAFVQYQRACYQAIKAVDARNQVLLGGISPTPNGSNSQGTTYAPVTWVQQLYANGLKGSFDLMNVHLYGDPSVLAGWSIWCQTFGCNGIVNPSITQVMAANSDSHPVVTTESGDNAASTNETTQANAVAGSLRDPRVQQTYVYDLLNTVNGFGMLVPDSTGTVTDPTGARWRKRPSYNAYQTNAT